VGLIACLDALRDDWRALLQDAENHNRQADQKVRRGVGVECMWYGCGNTGLSNPSAMRVVLKRSGRLVFYNGAVDIGQGSSTVLMQICADAVGLPVACFDYVCGDTDLTEDAGKTSASRQTFVSGKAAMLAGQALRARLLDLLGANSDTRLKLDGTTLIAELDYSQLTLALDTAEHTDEIVADGFGEFDPPITPLDEKGQGKAYATYAFAAQVCSLDVDTGLGTIKVRSFKAAHDVGRAINPQLIHGQIHGGILQGLGMALMEEYLPGQTENLHDYLIPTAGDVPDIDIHLIEEPEPLGPYGAKGVGEPALVPTPAAILSAIRHATGIAMDQVPVLPHRLLSMLHRANETGVDR
jgi:CO/xanthine dehydrogenase Mo-binding subunit